METENFATEILHELKANAKRWFIAFLAVLLLWFATIVGFLWYLTLPVEEYRVEQEASDRSWNMIGDNVYGSIPENYVQEKSRSE